MMETDFRCWWQNYYVGDFFRHVGDFLNVLNRQTCHQHIWSLTSVTNIDVTVSRSCMVKQVCTGLKADLGIKTNINIQHGQIGSHNSLNVKVSHYSHFEIKMLL